MMMKKKLRTLNMMLVFYVAFIMVSSGILTAGCYLLLANLGLLPHPLLVRGISPFLIVLFTVMVSTAVATVTTLRILKPVNSLIHATKRVAEGDFSVRVPEPTVLGEVSELVRSFNNMVSELSGIEMFRADFINNFSHEFKTPIVSIRGFARQLQRDDLSDGQRREYAGIIASEAERLSNMTANILLLTKLENQQIVTDRTEYRLDEQLRGAILLLEKAWSAKEIDLQLDLEEVTFLGNEEMVNHIWLNILGNAIKFSHQGGQVRVLCHAEGGRAVVTVSDDGIGMDETARRHIFEKFYQGDSAHAAEGYGLGLSLVKRIVDLCGGAIDVASQPDKGSTFRVELPLGDA